MKAYWRDDLQENADYPAWNKELTHDDWASLEFDIIEINEGVTVCVFDRL